jgi:hypothetical protein
MKHTVIVSLSLLLVGCSTSYSMQNTAFQEAMKDPEFAAVVINYQLISVRKQSIKTITKTAIQHKSPLKDLQQKLILNGYTKDDMSMCMDICCKQILKQSNAKFPERREEEKDTIAPFLKFFIDERDRLAPSHSQK